MAAPTEPCSWQNCENETRFQASAEGLKDCGCPYPEEWYRPVCEDHMAALVADLLHDGYDNVFFVYIEEEY